MTHEEAIAVLEESAVNAELYAATEGVGRAESLLKWAEIKEALNSTKAELDAIKRGEFVCLRCGLRKDSDPPSTDPQF